jgi:hypothetical protein
MPAPKWVFATGECAISGGPFWQAPTILEGADLVVPVDVYVPGCPPRPEAMWAGIHRLQEKIRLDGVYTPEPLREPPREFYERDPPLFDFRIRFPKVEKIELEEVILPEAVVEEEKVLEAPTDQQPVIVEEKVPKKEEKKRRRRRRKDKKKDSGGNE